MRKVLIVNPPSNGTERKYNKTGIDPRHRLVYLSLLPSGPDEVRNSLLRGDRSAYLLNPQPLRGNSAPHKADFG